MLRPNSLEPLPPRLLLSTTTFAVIGDFSDSPASADVAALVHSWSPSFIVSTGDNHSPGTPLDQSVGQLYHQYLSPYTGSFGPASPDNQNHFFPTLGQYDADDLPAYQSFFPSLPNNQRYYSTRQGDVEIFSLDSNPSEPDGLAADSPQAQWLKSALASSPARWKFVVLNQPPYSSGPDGPTTALQWPFLQWGATAVLSGHDRAYERLSVGGLPYLVDGLGGDPIQHFGAGAPDPGSQVRYDGDYGALRVTTSDSAATFQFFTRSGALVDTYTISAPAAPTNLTAAPASGGVALSWTPHSTTQAGFKIERSTDSGATFSTISLAPASATAFLDLSIPPGSAATYRVRAYNAAGDSGPTNPAAATADPSPAVSFLSDLTPTSATGGWGPVEFDTSNGGPAPGDGRPILLNGTSYPKGIGTHAPSDISYALNSSYDRFLADVGPDDESFGTVDFQVFADGRQIFDSGPLGPDSPVAHVDLPVAGAQTLLLRVTDAGDGFNGDHADWAGARLLAAPPPPPPPPPIQPTLSSLSAPASLPRTRKLTLTAKGVSKGTAPNVTQVLFYRDANQNGQLDPTDPLVARDRSPAAGWSATLPAAHYPPGPQTFFARAADSRNHLSTPSSTTVTLLDAPPTLARLKAHLTRPRHKSGGTPASSSPPSLTLTALSPRDPDGSVTAIRFVLDSNHNGLLDPTDTLLATRPVARRSSLTWSGPLPPSTTLSTPTQFLFALPQDNNGTWGNPTSTKLPTR